MTAAKPRVLVCEARTPFVTGNAEYLIRVLVGQLTRRGYDAELVSLPFSARPRDGLLSHAAAWRLLDLSESNNTPIDLVITTRFPTYFVRHPKKVAWLVRQYRSAYELWGTPGSDNDENEMDVGMREHLGKLDAQMLNENEEIFTVGRNTTARLKRCNGLTSEPLPHPPRLADQLRSGPYDNYVLSVSDLERIQRTDLIIRAMTRVDFDIRLVVVGDGTERAPLVQLATELGVLDRVDMVGPVEDAELLRLYEQALCMAHVPYDGEDGAVALEGLLARRPVVTTHDSSGTLEFVDNGVNGLVCFPDPQGLADGINRLASDRQLAASLGAAGYERARQITWDGVIERLTRVL